MHYGLILKKFKILQTSLCFFHNQFQMLFKKLWVQKKLGPPFWTLYRTPQFFLMKIKKQNHYNKLKLYTTCMLHTTASFALKFSSILRSTGKKVFSYTQCISKFSFSIREGNQERLSYQLLGQFPQLPYHFVAQTPVKGPEGSFVYSPS